MDEGAQDTMVQPGGPSPEPVAKTPDSAPSPPPPAPSPTPASVVGGGMSFAEKAARGLLTQQELFEMVLRGEQDASRQAQAAAGVRAGAAQAQNQLIQQYLSQPRPDVYKPQYKPMPKPPQAEFRSPLEAIGNPLAGLALVAGLFTRTPATATLKAAAAAMNAQRAGDQLGYENAQKEFRDKLDETMKTNEHERQQYLDSWNDRNKTMQERLADMEMKATMLKNNAMAAAARSGNVSQVQTQLNALGKFNELMKSYAPVAKNTNELVAQEFQRERARLVSTGMNEQEAGQKAAEYVEKLGISNLGKQKPSEEREKALYDAVYEHEKQNKPEIEARRLASEAVARSKNVVQLETAKMRAQSAMDVAKYRADAELDRLTRKVEADAKKDAEKAGRLQTSEVKTITGIREIQSVLQDLRSTWRDEFAGFTGVKTMDEFLAQVATKYGRQDLVNDAAVWWTKKNRYLDLEVRHKNFGAALTSPEIAAFNQANFDMSMSPANIRAIMDMLIDTENKIMRNNAAVIAQRGASPESLARAFGVSVGDLNLPGVQPAPAGGGSIYDELGLTPKP